MIQMDDPPSSSTNCECRRNVVGSSKKDPYSSSDHYAVGTKRGGSKRNGLATDCESDDTLSSSYRRRAKEQTQRMRNASPTSDSSMDSSMDHRQRRGAVVTTSRVRHPKIPYFSDARREAERLRRLHSRSPTHNRSRMHTRPRPHSRSPSYNRSRLHSRSPTHNRSRIRTRTRAHSRSSSHIRSGLHSPSPSHKRSRMHTRPHAHSRSRSHSATRRIKRHSERQLDSSHARRSASPVQRAVTNTQMRERHSTPPPIFIPVPVPTMDYTYGYGPWSTARNAWGAPVPMPLRYPRPNGYPPMPMPFHRMPPGPYRLPPAMRYNAYAQFPRMGNNPRPSFH